MLIGLSSLLVAVMCAVPASAAGEGGASTVLSGAWISNPSWRTVPAVGAATPAMPVWVKDFRLDQPVASAELVVAGPGVIDVSVNGHPASADVLGLGYTTESARLWSKAVDVTALLASGANRIGVQMAGGMSDVGVPGRYFKLQRETSPLMFAATLNVTLADGSQESINTDSSWLTALSGTSVADWYGGEDFDPSVLPADWQSPGVVVPGAAPSVPPSVLPVGAKTVTPVIGPGQQVVGPPLASKTVTKVSASSWVVDLGRQMAGWPQLSVTGTAGSVVRMFPAEQVHADGTVDQTSMGASAGAPVYDQYTLDGTAGGESWHPQFVYHGFRYVQVQVVSGAVTSTPQVSGLEIMTALDPAGSATYSDSTVAALDTLTRQSVRENLQSTATDCPDREKLGWLEETWLVFDTLSGYYDMSVYGQRMERVIADSQLPTGLVPDTAPEDAVFPGGFRDDVWWGQAVVQVPWKLYQTYADTATLATYWPQMVAYTAYIRGRSTTNLIGAGLGDWATQTSTDAALVANVGQYELLDTMARIATVLGKTSDATAYRAQANAVGASTNARWLHGSGTTATYGTDQASNALALDAGLVPSADVTGVRTAMLAALANFHGGALSVGEIAMPAMMRQMTAAGRADLLLTAIERTDRPGYGYIVASGATALPEYWPGNNTNGSSQAHFMDGYVVAFAREHLVGLAQTDTSNTYSHLFIAPQLTPGLVSASDTRVTTHGTVQVSWNRTGTTVTLTATLPDGVDGTVVLPSGTSTIGPGTTTVSSTGDQRFTLVTDPGGLGGGTRTFNPPPTPVPPHPTPPTSPAYKGTIYSAHGTQILYLVNGATATALNFQQWVALGQPAPTPPTSAEYTRYSWSPQVYVISRLGQNGPRITAAETASDWLAAGLPPVSVNDTLIPGSTITQYATGPQLILTDPDTTTHTLTAAEWTALGHPAYTRLGDQGWITLPGGPVILAVTSLATGAAHPATATEWAQAGNPTPASTPRPGQLRGAHWTTRPHNPQIYLQLTGASPIPVTYPEWAAAGFPAPTST